MLKTTYLCARCLVDQATHAVEMTVQDPEERLSIMKGVMDLLQREFPGKIPARLGTLVHHYVMERTGQDPYAGLKKKSNEAALDVMKSLDGEDLSFRQIIQLAVAGNAIDFGVDGSREALHTLRQELEKGLTVDHRERFYAEVESAGDILYLTDNCGEIVFDYHLIESLVKMGKAVTVSPKELPILNDATVEDLHSLGFERIARIVPHTRNDIGLFLSDAGEEFLKVWDRSDLVIAKGMGHFETLYGLDKKMVFLLKAKCIPVAEKLGVVLGSHVLTF